MLLNKIKTLTTKVVVAIMLLHSGDISAQIMDNRRQVDTLSLSERISVRTNMVDWVILTPNIGIEFDLGRTNWSRYAVNLNLRGRFNPSKTYAQPVTYGLTEVRLEGRQYWRERQAEVTGAFGRHRKLWDKLMSCRRMVPHHPKTTYYRGIYVAYDKYNIRIPHVYSFGRDGEQLTAGITWGFVRPLYGFSTGNSLDLELGISGGFGMTRYDSYQYDSKKGENVFLWASKWDIIRKPVLSEIRVGFVYRLGKYPIQKKYRWRYDVDLDYRNMKDAKYFKTDSIQWQKHRNDSLYKVANAEFRHLYDSITAIHAKEEQQKINVKAEKFLETLDSKGGAVKEKTRAQKTRDKERAKARKEEEMKARKGDEL